MIAEYLMIPGQAEQVGDSEGSGAQYIALRGDSVAVAADHLHHRIEAFFEQYLAGCQAAHAHHTGLIIRHVAGIDVAFQDFRFFAHHFGSGATRRPGLGGDGEISGF